MTCDSGCYSVAAAMALAMIRALAGEELGATVIRWLEVGYMLCYTAPQYKTRLPG